MFNRSLLNPEAQQFIRNYKEKTDRLAFKGSPFKDISARELIGQIESRNRIEKKLPLWFETPNIIYPPKLNLEQTSSEITARYKASLVSGKSLADVTGGFGVDSYYFSEKVKTVHHFEINRDLSEIAAHNFQVLNKTNIDCFVSDGIAAANQAKYSTIYADPSRRHDRKGKVFFLKDCEPNIPEALPLLLQNCEIFLLKTSPMLDISVGLKELKLVSEIHIVAIDNDVKELLWVIKPDATKAVRIKTINFKKNEEQHFEFPLAKASHPTYSLPRQYLYEPNAAILKSGGFNMVSEQLQIDKLHDNTHLFTSSNLIAFPGRRFRIIDRIPYRKSEMRKALTFSKANVTVRNFPESVKTLRKKWKIKDGGSTYLFFTTTIDNKKEMLICSRV